MMYHELPEEVMRFIRQLWYLHQYLEEQNDIQRAEDETSRR